MVYTDGRPISTGFTDTADAFAWFGTGWLSQWASQFQYDRGHGIRGSGMVPTQLHTRFGRYVYALGGNELPTRLM